ncbi:hypothetical protein KL928_001929 [Ogataea angusta]|uniref:Copper-fist domain-containing protein n=1 Tax=Pichia angusta TaxID=870730 RepID=A0AAN6I6F5_PICAN|nr:uncharacterized protein KL928_001929 [Ogataea angusta]KAG7820492.1 hypothetical protein KL928_001929 [Ogataea angusta]KAG7838729.1 hypothetical protein KL943_000805 [Ogataea angusta]
MILVDGDKYACEQCIRGHRSSQCQHIKRHLVLVRSRGRPATDSSKRIAIMGEQLIPADSQHDNHEHCGCPQSHNPENSVIVLKANKRQVFNVSKKSLKLLDPVIEVPNKQAGLELIANRSHGRGSCRSKRAKKQPEHRMPAPATSARYTTRECRRTHPQSRAARWRCSQSLPAAVTAATRRSAAVRTTIVAATTVKSTGL